MTRSHTSAKDLGVGAYHGIAEHPQVQLTLIGECGNGQTLVPDKRQDGKCLEEFGSEGVQRHWWSRNIRDYQVEERLRVHDDVRSPGQDPLGSWFEESQEGCGGKGLVTTFVLSDFGRHGL